MDSINSGSQALIQSSKILQQKAAEVEDSGYTEIEDDVPLHRTKSDVSPVNEESYSADSKSRSSKKATPPPPPAYQAVELTDREVS